MCIVASPTLGKEGSRVIILEEESDEPDGSFWQNATSGGGGEGRNQGQQP